MIRYANKVLILVGHVKSQWLRYGPILAFVLIIVLYGLPLFTSLDPATTENPSRTSGSQLGSAQVPIKSMIRASQGQRNDLKAYKPSIDSEATLDRLKALKQPSLDVGKLDSDYLNSRQAHIAANAKQQIDQLIAVDEERFQRLVMGFRELEKNVLKFKTETQSKLTTINRLELENRAMFAQIQSMKVERASRMDPSKSGAVDGGLGQYVLDTTARMQEAYVNTLPQADELNKKAAVPINYYAGSTVLLDKYPKIEILTRDCRRVVVRINQQLAGFGQVELLGDRGIRSDKGLFIPRGTIFRCGPSSTAQPTLGASSTQITSLFKRL